VRLVLEAVLGEHERVEPKVSVSRMSAPAAGKRSCTPWITSGRVSTRFSLHPSRSRRRSQSGPSVERAWMECPMAPSSTRIARRGGVQKCAMRVVPVVAHAWGPRGGPYLLRGRRLFNSPAFRLTVTAVARYRSVGLDVAVAWRKSGVRPAGPRA
jgi:hypothetical protein